MFRSHPGPGLPCRENSGVAQDRDRSTTVQYRQVINSSEADSRDNRQGESADGSRKNERNENRNIGRTRDEVFLKLSRLFLGITNVFLKDPLLVRRLRERACPLPIPRRECGQSLRKEMYWWENSLTVLFPYCSKQAFTNVRGPKERGKGRQQLLQTTCYCRALR